MQKVDKKKAGELAAEGEKLIKNGKYKKGLSKFRKAHEYDPDNTAIYNKLIAAHEKATKDWKIEDLAESVGWSMKIQEIEDPSMKMVHAQMTPEWNELMGKIAALIQCANDDEEIKIIEEIHAYGSTALYPLIFTLLQIKKGARGQQGTTNVQDEK